MPGPAKMTGDYMRQLFPRVSKLTQEESEKLEREQRRLGMPLEMHRWPWKLAEAEVEPKLVEACKVWLAHRDVNLLLLGPSGCAKGAAVMKVLRKLRKEGVRDGGEPYRFARHMAYVKATDLCEVKSGDKFVREVEPEVRRSARVASLFVLDDLGKEPVSHGLFEVLDHRYDVANRPGKQCAPTIVTSELGEKALANKYDDGTVRRLMSHGGRNSIVVDLTTGEK